MHLNGDEAVCFGTAFIAANSSASYKVRKVYLTQHPSYQISIEVTPADDSKQKSQVPEAIEDVGEGESSSLEDQLSDNITALNASIA